MIAHHVHDAIAQVNKLQELVLQRHSFRGYSGPARMVSGTLALVGTAVLGARAWPATPVAHLLGWGVILLLALGANYGYMAYWFLFDRDVRRNPRMLKPAVDAVPALAAGGLLSVAFVLKGDYDYLFGLWLCMYGLSQTAYRGRLPRMIYVVGVSHMLCGAVYLLHPGASFTNPWPFGLALFAGEWVGGVALHQDHAHSKQREREIQ